MPVDKLSQGPEDQDAVKFKIPPDPPESSVLAAPDQIPAAVSLPDADNLGQTPVATEPLLPSTSAEVQVRAGGEVVSAQPEALVETPQDKADYLRREYTIYAPQSDFETETKIESSETIDLRALMERSEKGETVELRGRERAAIVGALTEMRMNVPWFRAVMTQMIGPSDHPDHDEVRLRGAINSNAVEDIAFMNDRALLQYLGQQDNDFRSNGYNKGQGLRNNDWY